MLAGWLQLHILVHIIKRVTISNSDKYFRTTVFPGIFTSNTKHMKNLPLKDKSK